MIGAWVENYTPLRPGSHPQRGRIVRATYRPPGSLMGGRLQTLEGFGLGDGWFDDMVSDSSGGEVSETSGGPIFTDPMAQVVAQSSNDTDWLHLVSNIVSAGGKATGSALTAFSAAKQAEGKTQAQISAMISAAMGQAQSGGLSGTTIGLGIGALALAAIAFLVFSRRSRSNPSRKGWITGTFGNLDMKRCSYCGGGFMKGERGNKGPGGRSYHTGCAANKKAGKKPFDWKSI